MKKKKLNAKLALKKNVISKLDTGKLTGGNGEISTTPQCILTGPLEGCEVTCNCNTEGCNNSNGCGDPTNQTQQIITCLVPCN
ncbi:hypothetical protein GWK08_03900 [Leptobacterium flavescens]|uniref:Uncharacterized protein n=1 Tax=Leptobacterium flavescens TaxID=472055 RepID=A0A6P0UJ54_9FLAO|nr:hypothetical protein [Leptobacterium flavescens]NER12572.1 hypothetical protein [Leptobacterium flavescens]